MRGSSLRLVISLLVASTLAGVMLLTVFGGTVKVTQVHELARVKGTTRLNGTVVDTGETKAGRNGRVIVLEDNDPKHYGSDKISVIYNGTIPDNLDVGRAVLVQGKLLGRVFHAETDSLSTKCPSKYQSKSQNA